MKRSVNVCLGEAGTLVGSLNFDATGQRQSVAFAYAPSWLANPARFALSPDLPMVSGFQYRANKTNPTNRATGESTFFACFADSEPDGWGRKVILRDHAKQRLESVGAVVGQAPVGPLNDFDFLLRVNDFSRVGAIRLQDANGVFQRASGQARDTPALIALPDLLAASKAVEQGRETARDLAYLRGNGTSLGGLRPKCSVIDADGSLAIGKFPSVADTRSIVHGEVLALNLAASAGIRAAKARVVDAQGVSVAVITRFDRLSDAEPNPESCARRLMYLSARSLLQATESQQYTYVDIANAIRMHSSQAALDLAELWRRMVFNILINNVDDHLNNHGFLHVAHDQWLLAPAFDVNPFPDKERALKTWISEDAGDAASVDQALAAAPFFGLSPSTANAELNSVRSAVKNWKAIARGIGMIAGDVEAYAPAFLSP
jgi:serine/threonine-protein kinase HipA